MTNDSGKATILFIMPRQADMMSLQTTVELRNLRDGLLRENNRDALVWQDLPAARLSDLAWGLRTHKPQIVHYTGHSSENGDLLFDPEEGQLGSVPLSPERFVGTLRAHQAGETQRPVRLVVLAGCHTARAAELAAQVVGCAVGLAGEPSDVALAKHFTPNLYAALAEGRSVQNAVEVARAELDNQGQATVAQMVRMYPPQGERCAVPFLEAASKGDEFRGDLRLAYLRSLFSEDCEWAKVSMSLFAPDEIRLARKISLLDIFTPLPVDFAITLELTEKGTVKDWWSGALGSQHIREVEPEWYEVAWNERAVRSLKEMMREERKLRQKTWVDLDVDKTGLAPLVALASDWVAGQKTDRQHADNRLLWRADASHAALVQPRFVLVGDPGSGKSTFLRHLALCWAGQLLKDAGQDGAPAAATLQALPGWKQAYTPIYIELRTLVNSFPPLVEGDDQSLKLPGLRELRNHLRLHLPLKQEDDGLVDVLFGLLSQGKAALLLDGLDEVSEASAEGRQRQLHAFVGCLVDEFDQAPILVTARPYAYEREEWLIQGFGHTQLVELEAERQKDFAQHLFQRLLRADRTRHADQETEAFVAALATIPDDLRSNPLLLTLLAALWIRQEPDRHDLPSTRGALYRQAVNLLVKDWVATKHQGYALPLDERTWRFVLEQAAFDAQERRSSRDDPATVLETDIFRALRAVGKGRVADDLLDHLAQQSGILERIPGLVETFDKQYKFLHLSFQEYLTACELLHRPEDERPQGLPLFEGRRFPTGLANRMIAAPVLWANVLRFAVDELIYKDRIADACTLLAGCCEPYRSRGEDLQPALLALQVALDAGLLERARSTGATDYRLLCDDARAVLRDYDRFAPEQRDIAGKLLGSDPLPGHDPRRGVGLRPDGLPDIEWVEVPDLDSKGKGEWTYQKGIQEPLKTYWIARYPITYAQFQAFVKDGGFETDHWWQGLSVPPGHRDQPGTQAFEYWNHPRERVSWWDAIAFCRWLTAKAQEHPDLLPGLDRVRTWEITLPTEQQWEKTARGHGGRQYPWGNKYKEGRANIDETARFGGTPAGPHFLGKTSAVGMYPHAKPDDSPYGVADLSGNVWEWCLNEYESGKTDPGGSAARVLRGGSWNFNPFFAAAPFRVSYLPDSRLNSFGFRVVAGLPPP